jgi:hypothetical protein
LDDPGDHKAYVYPDPAKDGKTAKVVFHSDGACTARVHVYKSDGEEAEVEEGSYSSAGVHSLDLDTSKLAPGVYFYTLDKQDRTGGKSRTDVNKFMVVR